MKGMKGVATAEPSCYVSSKPPAESLTAMKHFLPTVLGVASLICSAHAGDADISKVDTSKLPPAARQKGVTYAKDIKPMLEASCIRCHGEERQKGGLRLDSLEALLKGGEDGKVVTPGKSEKSLLVIAAAQID